MISRDRPGIRVDTDREAGRWEASAADMAGQRGRQKARKESRRRGQNGTHLSPKQHKGTWVTVYRVGCKTGRRYPHERRRGDDGTKGDGLTGKAVPARPSLQVTPEPQTFRWRWRRLKWWESRCGRCPEVCVHGGSANREPLWSGRLAPDSV
jgi:hypothetical protein